MITSYTRWPLTCFLPIILLTPTIVAALIALDKAFILPSALLNTIMVCVTIISAREYWKRTTKTDECVSTAHAIIAFYTSVFAVTISWFLFREKDSESDNTNIYAVNLVTTMATCINNISFLLAIITESNHKLAISDGSNFSV